ncbi:MAG: LysR family transcriptional regulator [Sediminimonas qiaohouensis]|uniref:LysR family transcriptional regulator n=1 Tax=Sediminimonas qiaohouensis TaxID=552061 RepID=A0A7C9L9M0_9RHOB|nr:LysR family transcriptional regulator [Sediminimonas qiaohouensis]MTJ03377.1 LysR family transcriptional regulator [Sediminimonas qiaohouensis]
MKRALPPLTWYRSFEAAARHLSFTAAASEVGLTQSAVSQQVKALETRLRIALFTRQPRGLALTDDGRRLLPQVSAALEQLATAADMFDMGPTDSVLTVAMSVSMAQWVVAPRLAEFTAAHPGLRLRILSAIWPDDFSSAMADVEVRFGSRKQAGTDARELTPSRLIALKAPSLQAPLPEAPLIEAVGTSDGWKNWGRATGLDGLRPTLFADSYGMALQLAAHGNGVALISEVLAGHSLETGDLVRAHAASIPGKEGYYLSVNVPSAAANDFQDWLLTLLKQ